MGAGAIHAGAPGPEPARRMSLRYRLHVLLHNPDGTSVASLLFNRALALLIVANSAAVALETVPNYWAEYEGTFAALESISLVLFLIEYMTRLWVCVDHDKYRGRSWPR